MSLILNEALSLMVCPVIHCGTTSFLRQPGWNSLRERGQELGKGDSLEGKGSSVVEGTLLGSGEVLSQECTARVVALRNRS